MKTARLLVVAAAVLMALAALYVFLQSSSSTAVQPRALGPGGTVVSPAGASADALVAQLDGPAATAAGSGERDAAPSVLASGARELEVRVSAPEGTTPDAELHVVAVAAAALEDETRDELLDRLRQRIDARSAAASAVDAHGVARLALPAELEDPVLLLDGRFLYLKEPFALPPDVERVELDARLGACLVVRLAQGADAAATTGELSLTGGDFSGRRGGRQRRSRDVRAPGTVTFRALNTDLTWSLVPTLESLHADPHVGLELEPGQELTLDVVPTPGVLLSGSVLDGSGAPLEGTQVRTADGSPWMNGADVRSTETDARGTFELAGVAPGTLQLEALLDGWRSARSEELELAEGERRTGIRLVLDRGEAIAGIVRWSDGRPAAEVEVAVEALRERGGWGNWGGPRVRRAGQATTDDAGRFRVTGLDAGSYTLRASIDTLVDQDGEAQGGATWRAVEVDVRSGRSDLELTLEGPLPFAGRVVDDLGAPVVAFEIEVEAADEGGAEEAQDYEDDEGRFVFARVGPGEWRVSAGAEGHVRSEPVELSLPGDGGELEIALERTARVEGRVVDAAGVPVAGATVGADDGRQRGNPWGGRGSARVETDDDGAFELAELAPGTLELVAQAGGWADSLPLALELPPGATRDDTLLVLRIGGRIEGAVVTPEGDPLPGRRVTWGSNAMGFGARDETRTDSVGRFAFQHVTPGDWAVSAAPSFAEMSASMRGRRDQGAFADAMSDLVSETVSVLDGELVEVYLGGEPRQPVRIFGVVTRAGEPLAEAQVYAVSEGSAVFEGMKTARTNDDGSYELVVDRPGAYVVSATLDLYSVEAVVDVPRAEEARVDLAIPLGRIEGVVREPGARPAVGVSLALQREDGLGRMRWRGGRSTTDDEGRFAFEALEAGRYTVRANVSSWGQRADEEFGAMVRDGVLVERDATTPGIDFRLEKAGAIEGLVRGPDGSTVAGASLFFRDGGGRMVTLVSGTVTDAAGRFRRDGLAPGEYAISVRADGYAANDLIQVLVQEGAVGRAELELEQATTLVVTLEEQGGDAQRARVEVFDRDGREVGGLMTRQSLRASFNEGTSSLEQRVGPLPPGRYTVRATTTDGRSAEKRILLRARDAQKKLRLKLDS